MFQPPVPISQPPVDMFQLLMSQVPLPQVPFPQVPFLMSQVPQVPLPQVPLPQVPFLMSQVPLPQVPLVPFIILSYSHSTSKGRAMVTAKATNDKAKTELINCIFALFTFQGSWDKSHV